MAGRCAVVFLAALWAAIPAWGDEPVEKIYEGTVVDQAGQPIKGAIVSVPGKSKLVTTTAADGTFRLPLGSPGIETHWVELHVQENAEGGRLSYVLEYDDTPQRPVRVELKPPHELSVRVVDGEGQPVEDADVRFLSRIATFTKGRTDADGRWSGQVPSDSDYWAIIARKGWTGFDYEAAVDHFNPFPHKTESMPLPGELTLVLDGSRTLLVKTVDHHGKPMEGIPIRPGGIKLEDQPSFSSLSHEPDFVTTTNEDGVVEIDWLPERFQNSITISTETEEFSPNGSTMIRAGDGVEEMTITLLPRERISGRVTHADGRPAEGILVSSIGRGFGDYTGHAEVKTDAHGRYEMDVYSGQIYVIYVLDDEWAAPYRTDIILLPEKPVEGIDFSLIPVTRVHGRVTLGDSKTPVPDTRLTLSSEYREMPESLLALRPEGNRRGFGPTLYLQSKTDAEGRFEFNVGPGEYQLYGVARAEPVTLEIPTENPPEEIEQNFHMDRPETGPFTVTVVDGDGKPVAGAGVYGVYRAHTSRDWYQPIKTDENGQLKTERSLDPVVIYADNDDESLAGIARVGAEETEATITIGPTATASGKLLDKEGNVLPDKELRYGIRVHIGPDEDSPWTDSFGGNVTTDKAGRFTLAGLIPEEEYHVNIKLDESSSRRVTVVTAKDTESIDLGELKIDPNPTPPYVPPTPAERLAKAFDNKADMPLDERLADLLAEARREYTAPLLLVGPPEDAGCIDLYTAFYEQPEPVEGEEDAAEKPKPKTPRDLRWEFELAALSLERPEVAELASELGLSTTENGPAVLVVLAEDGSLIATHQLVVTDGKLDRAALTAFLLEHKRPTRDAERMLADALAKARAEDKRVYLIASASWCGPCRMLARFLDPHKAELDKHYVFVKLDVSRDEHGDAVRDRYQGDRDGGVPWHAILDADGKTLVTSNRPEDGSDQSGANIGYPSSPDGIAHFLSMLKETAPRLSEESREKLKAALAKED